MMYPKVHFILQFSLKRYLLLIFLAWSVVVNAQQPPTAIDLEIEKAQFAFKYKRYNTAAGLFKKIYPKVKEEDKRDQILFMIAESYRLSNNFSQAIDWYEKLVNTKYPDPKILFSYGLLLKNFERYEEASTRFNDFLFEQPKDPSAIREQLSCATAMKWKNNPEKFTIVNLGTMNTSASDYAPFFTNQNIYWSSARPEATGTEIFEWTGQKCADYFETKWVNGSPTEVKKVLGPVNTKYNEGTIWVDTTETTMFLTQCNGIDGTTPGCKIYVSYRKEKDWSMPELLPFNADTFSNGHPAMTIDGKRLYFASDMPGGLGNKDIYYVEYNNITNQWSSPINLGPNVNTPEDDMFPFVDEDGVIYFASKGWEGMGGLDIFTTRFESGNFTKAQNLRYPINSGGDDFGISFIPKHQRIANGPIAFFTSNRQGGKGDDDLYSLAIKPFVFLVRGTVVDAETNSAIGNTKVPMLNDKGEEILSFRTTEDGKFTGEIPPGILAQVYAEKNGYFNSLPVTIDASFLDKDTLIELTLKMLAIPSTDYEFTLEGIYYDLDRFELRREAKTVLDSLVKILNNNPTIVIELASHTDSRASDEYNMTLSQKRAQSCVDYLTQLGVPKERMVAKGYGETKLINDCTNDVDCSEEEHQQNRRTTIRVLRTDYKPKRR